MAIFIIDQFSLNTDLPLDIRYVPSAGRFDPDISVYKYPGMQVYDTNEESIWYCDNNLNWVEVGSGSDASLNELFTLITDLSTLITQHDGSINNLYNITNIIDASIIRIDTSLNDYGNLLRIHDNSIGDLEVRIDSTESSIAYLTLWNTAQDASINRIDTSIGQLDTQIQSNILSISQLDSSIINLNLGQLIQDASIEDLRIKDISQDASIGVLNGKITIIDGSITYLTNITNIHEASIGQIEDDLLSLNASLGDYVKKTGDTMTGDLIVTGIDITNDLSVGGNSIFLGDVAIRGDLMVDGSLTYIHTDELDVSTGFIKLNAGLTGVPPETLQSGIIIGRGTEEPYVFLYDETDQTFRIGIASETSTGYLDSSTQAVATREDSPTVNGIAVWNDSEERFDTFTSLTFTDTNGLDIDVSLKLNAYSGASDLMLIVGTDGYVKAVPTLDGSINDLYSYIDGSLSTRDSSISANTGAIVIIDGSITYLTNVTNIHDVSIGNLYDITNQLDSSIIRIDGSINDLYTQLITQDTSVKGAMNVGDGSAAVYAGITTDGSLQFREFVGVGAATVTQNGNLIEISIDASFGGEVNTASNIGTGEGLSVTKIGQDLPFKSIDTNQPSQVLISSDNSTLYIDVSVSALSDASISGLTDTSINELSKIDHQIIEWDADASKWINTNGILWDVSLGTTTDDIGGIPAGTDLEGQTLKEILYKILYEYQIPVLSVGSDPIAGIYEKGLVSTQFSTVDVSWNAANTNYPLAKLNNIRIVKTGSGTIYEASLGLVDSDSNSYTDSAGILNWGGTNRTINYNVEIDDDQGDKSQPAVIGQSSLAFYYRQFWGMVPGTTNINQVDSDMITGLAESRLVGETDLIATFDNSTGGFVKYLFAYPDTVAAPDNFGVLSEILDQNDFNLTDSFTSENEDVSIGNNNVRYRFYLANNKVDTSIFEVTFKF